MERPSLHEASEFGDLYGIPESVIANWYEYCEACDWKISGEPIRNWKGALLKFNGRRIHTINSQMKLARRNRNG